MVVVVIVVVVVLVLDQIILWYFSIIHIVCNAIQYDTIPNTTTFTTNKFKDKGAH